MYTVSFRPVTAIFSRRFAEKKLETYMLAYANKQINSIIVFKYETLPAPCARPANAARWRYS